MPERFADITKHVPWFAKRRGLAHVVESFLGFVEIRELFADSVAEANPFAGVARRAGVEIGLDGLADEIPKTGPVVIVANHSHGGPDALALAAKCVEVRPDTLILCNRELMALPGVNRFFLPVSILESGNAAENSATLRKMLKHVKGGGALVVFPAGRVAYWQEGVIKDPPWNDHVVKLMSRMEATVVPVWFFGGNPAWIQILSKLSAFIRTALIPRGLLELRGRTIVGRVGKAFSSDRLREGGAVWLRGQLEELRDLGN
ncbi:MAG: 1-acyl-sn-glycerol-3-phosphate acyltransferase [Verrucomicrobiaceae bacterium]